MSHAGRRIASAAAATAAIAVPVIAATSAHADGLPIVGGLPAVGSLTGALPLSSIPVNSGMLSNLTGATGNLPVVGGLTSGLTSNLSGDQSGAAATAPQGTPMPAAPAPAAPAALAPAAAGASSDMGNVEGAAHHYTGKHGKARV